MGQKTPPCQGLPESTWYTADRWIQEIGTKSKETMFMYQKNDEPKQRALTETDSSKRWERRGQLIFCCWKGSFRPGVGNTPNSANFHYSAPPKVHKAAYYPFPHSSTVQGIGFAISEGTAYWLLPETRPDYGTVKKTISTAHC